MNAKGKSDGDNPAASVVRDWWRQMQPGPSRRGDRAALARLRRAATAAEALREPEVIDLCRKLGVSARSRAPSPGRVAALAAVLSHVRQEVDPQGEGEGKGRPSMMRLVGPQGTSDDARAGAKLKEIRFRSLLAVREDDELLTAMRRLVSLAGDKANIRDLARAMLFWTDETRTRWAFEYYGATPSNPKAETTSQPTKIESAP